LASRPSGYCYFRFIPTYSTYLTTDIYLYMIFLTIYIIRHLLSHLFWQLHTILATSLDCESTILARPFSQPPFSYIWRLFDSSSAVRLNDFHVYIWLTCPSVRLFWPLFITLLLLLLLHCDLDLLLGFHCCRGGGGAPKNDHFDLSRTFFHWPFFFNFFLSKEMEFR
jgi:hypothetical protein